MSYNNVIIIAQTEKLILQINYNNLCQHSVGILCGRLPNYTLKCATLIITLTFWLLIIWY